MRSGATCAAVALLASAASAEITTSGGMLELKAPPPSLQEGMLESDSSLFVFQEQAGFELPTKLKVNLTAPGFYDDLGGLPKGKIPAGTEIDSYFVHLDNDESVDGIPMLTGSITFEEGVEVLGIIFKKGKLNLSDLIVGVNTTEYNSLNKRGLELKGADWINWTVAEGGGGQHTVEINGRVANGVDEVRIITTVATVPAPAALALLGTAGIVASRRRRSRC